MAIYPCCCVSSTIGATIIGALNIIGGLLGLIWGRITYTALKQIKKLLKKDSEDESQYRSGTNWYNEELSKKIALLQPRLIYGMVMSLASIVTASILLHGIKNTRPRLILAYLVVNVIMYIFSIFYSVFNYDENNMMYRDFIVIAFLINLYFLVVVCHAYMEISKALNRNDTFSAVTYTRT
ncbi:unnamed protein product [Orchesella dallaii]|uniref:Uncharacterized protein n=1 Tax=Orchesella dallaii TaxID=48710 RepID=A0ABP1QMQ9_9HEXA